MSKKSVNFIVNEPLYRLAMLYSMYDVTTKRDLAHLFVNLLFDAEDDVLPNGKTIDKELVEALREPPMQIKETQEIRDF